MIDRRPLAPVFCTMASSAMAYSASREKLSFTCQDQNTSGSTFHLGHIHMLCHTHMPQPHLHSPEEVDNLQTLHV